MTISESIIQWLYTNDSLDIVGAIDTDNLSADTESMALFKQPNRIVTEYIGGSKDVTDYYYFLLKQSAQLDSTRISNQEWLSNLEEWIDHNNMIDNLPELGSSKTAYKVAISTSYYMTEKTQEEATYQLGLEISYIQD